MRFVAPPALSTRRVHSTQACLTWYVPPSGFRTLLTVCSSNGLPGLVSCRSAHGVPALQSFSLARSRGASRHPMPSCRPPVRTCQAATQGPCWQPTLRSRGTPSCFAEQRAARSRAKRRPVRRVRLQGFAPRDESVARAHAFRPGQRPMLSWACVLVRAPARRRATVLPPTLLPRAPLCGAPAVTATDWWRASGSAEA